ncbi:MAG: hypothetical protein KJO55_06530, partial [Gammaproteobacteria bacterium]|nr:hypothetical protein [Gammaproteobacteria bacterium]
NVGKLYIIMNSSEHPEFIDDDATLDLVVETWHGQVGRAIIEGWGFAEDKALAAADHMDLERNASGAPDLTDVVTTAWLMAREADGEEIHYDSARALSRLQIDEEKREQIMRESVDDINALAQALNG